MIGSENVTCKIGIMETNDTKKHNKGSQKEKKHLKS